MIIFWVTMNALPKNQKEVMQTLLSLIRTVREEKGCLSYDVFCDLEDNHVFSLIEGWETHDDFDRHMRSEGFSVLLGTKSLLGKPMDMKIHTVSRTEAVEVVKALKFAEPLSANHSARSKENFDMRRKSP